MRRHIRRLDGSPLHEAFFSKKKKADKKSLRDHYYELPREVRMHLHNTARDVHGALSHYAQQKGIPVPEDVMWRAKDHLEEAYRLSKEQQQYLHQLHHPQPQQSRFGKAVHWLDTHAPRSIQDPLLKKYTHLLPPTPEHLGPGGKMKHTFAQAKPLIGDLRKAYDVVKILRGP